jgi:hypothetical protein
MLSVHMWRACLLVGLLVGLATDPGAVAGAAHSGPSGRVARPSGLAGRALEAPTCPVERVPPQPGCAPRPLAARLRIQRAGGHTRAKTVQAGSDGRFRVSLLPGTYTVRALRLGDSLLPRPPGPVRVQVRTGRFTTITVTYDSGIR